MPSRIIVLGFFAAIALVPLISCGGDTVERRTVLATSLYHALLMPTLRPADLAAGGTLRFEMGVAPSDRGRD